jgi:hypothetical protein
MDDGMHTRKTTLQTLILAPMVAMLAGCGALIVGGAPPGGYDAAVHSNGVQTSHDGAITASITSKYIKDPRIDALAIRVTTYRSVVTLQGAVKSEVAASRAIELAQATPHVRRVVSRLTVAP